MIFNHDNEVATRHEIIKQADTLLKLRASQMSRRWAGMYKHLDWKWNVSGVDMVPTTTLVYEKAVSLINNCSSRMMIHNRDYHQTESGGLRCRMQFREGREDQFEAIIEFHDTFSTDNPFEDAE